MRERDRGVRQDWRDGKRHWKGWKDIGKRDERDERGRKRDVGDRKRHNEVKAATKREGLGRERLEKWKER